MVVEEVMESHGILKGQISLNSQIPVQFPKGIGSLCSIETLIYM